MITAYRAWSTRRRRSSSDGKNVPVRSLGIRSSRSPAVVDNVRGRCPLRCAGAGLGAFVGFGADHRGQLGLDQRLVDRRRRLPDPVGHIGLLDRVQAPRAGQTETGPSRGFLSRGTWRLHAKTHAMAPSHQRRARRSRPDRSYTTPGDVTLIVLQVAGPRTCDAGPGCINRMSDPADPLSRRASEDAANGRWTGVGIATTAICKGSCRRAN